ncbi:hypothetical protein FEM48_Zijuj08G0068500 [Ziziphus jujuba var. spinosa]|uniref:Uncharacterized protein n=1 Tax=Ziziphus jujuba var. spinosa TaxID=714518 RepID=A0A978UXL6_ZIZJJ|nr:hypothetical protein FEM48_Zijuj08G0068500 [Ziziphus jujuba var. spinosa]
MESRSSGSAISIPSSSSSRPPKRLLFDRRYGWVIDEWKDPSEEALAGGRGMFCILPLAKALLKMASQSINVAANLAVKALERPDLFSPQVLQAGLNDQLHKLKSSVRKPDMNNFFLKGNSSSQEA